MSDCGHLGCGHLAYGCLKDHDVEESIQPFRELAANSIGMAHKIVSLETRLRIATKALENIVASVDGVHAIQVAKQALSAMEGV